MIITLGIQKYEYLLSVNGDGNGDSIINMDDVLLSAKYLINGAGVLGDIYLKAIDIDDNNEININDIIKMVKEVNKYYFCLLYIKKRTK